MFIRTERLFLRPAWEEDSAALAAAIGHEQVARMLSRVPWPYAEADARDFVALDHGPLLPNLLITLPDEGGAIVGGCGLHDVGGQPAVGYWITPSHWGRGIAAEALGGLVHLARLCGHRRLLGYHAGDNPASGRVMRRAGFQPTGGYRNFHLLARGHEVNGPEYALDLCDSGDDQPCRDGGPMPKPGWPGRWRYSAGIRAAA